MSFQTERLTITTAGSRMARSILDFYVRNREHLREWEDSKDPGFYTLSRQKANIRAENVRLRNGTGFDFWLIDKATSEIAGKIMVFGIISGNFSLCVIGYKLDESHVGKGLMREAMLAVERFLFDEIGLRRLELNIMPHNTRSINVARALGYSLECEVKAYIRINGRWQDHLRFVKINPNFKDR